MVFLCIVLPSLLAGCTVQRWHIDGVVPLGAERRLPRDELIAAADASCPIQPRPASEFRSDGCSLWPDSDLAGCCVAHDLAYWCGGSAEARREADSALADCIRGLGHPLQARLMEVAVRFGGHPLWPFYFRWGYGRPWRGVYWDSPERAASIP